MQKFFKKSFNLQEEQELSLRIFQARLLAVMSTEDSSRIIQIGENILSFHRIGGRFQNSVDDFFHMLTCRKLAWGYYLKGEHSLAKKMFECHKKLKFPLSNHVKYWHIWVETMIQLHHGVSSKIIKQIQKSRDLSIEIKVPSDYISLLFGVIKQLKYTKPLPQVKMFAVSELSATIWANHEHLDFESLKNYLELEIQLEFERAKSNKQSFDLQIKISKYRQFYATWLENKFKTQYSQSMARDDQWIQNYSKELRQFKQEVRNLNLIPHPKYFYRFQDKFFKIHFDYHQLFSSRKNIKKFLSKVCSQITFDRSQFILELHIHKIQFQLDEIHYLTDQNLIMDVTSVLDYVQSTKDKQIYFINRNFSEIFFLFDQKLSNLQSQRFRYSLSFIHKISTFLHQKFFVNAFSCLKRICQNFLLILNSLEDFTKLTNELCCSKHVDDPSMCLLLYLMYHKVLEMHFSNLKYFDSVLLGIVKNISKTHIKIQFILKQKFHFLVAQRLYSALCEAENEDSKSVNIMNRPFSIQRIKKNCILELRRQFRNPYSEFGQKKKKPPIQFLIFENSINVSVYLANFAKKKIAEKEQIWINNKK